MADILINLQKFGDFNSPLQGTVIAHQANNDICDSIQKEACLVPVFRPRDSSYLIKSFQDFRMITTSQIFNLKKKSMGFKLTLKTFGKRFCTVIKLYSPCMTSEKRKEIFFIKKCSILWNLWNLLETFTKLSESANSFT